MVPFLHSPSIKLYIFVYIHIRLLNTGNKPQLYSIGLHTVDKSVATVAEGYIQRY